MHGLINRSLQCFIRDTYGEDKWRQVAELADISATGFEAMLTYDDAETTAVVSVGAKALGQSQADFLENLGTYLVAHENLRAVRRLLRFGGATFEEFLLSLEELPDRVRMAVPDLEIPKLELDALSEGHFHLKPQWDYPQFDFVILGVLRGMADDYGALVFLDYQEDACGVEQISISVVESQFSEGKRFDLAEGLAQS